MKFNACISDIAEVIMGQSPKGKDVNNTGDGIPLLNGPTEFSSRYPKPVQFTTEGRKFSKPGDILFCVRGSTTGKMNYADQEYAIGRGIAAIRGKNGYPTPYVRAVMERNLDRLLVAATGSTFPNVGKDLLFNLEVETVSPEESLSINELIVSLEDKIEVNRQINLTLEQIVQAIFKNWFVDFGPVKAKIEAKQNGQDPELAAVCTISGKTEEQLKGLDDAVLQQLKTTVALFPDVLVEAELGEIPEGWEVKGLPEVIDFLEGPGIRNWQYTEENDGIKFINIRCIKDGDLNLKTASKLTKEEALGKYAHFLLDVDDIVVSASGTLGRYAFIRSEHLPLSLNTSVIRLKKINGVSTLHFIHGFVDTQLQWELETRASGSAQRNFGPMHLKMIEILMPNIELLKRHNEIIEPMFRQRQMNLKEIDSLATFRDTLLPKLLSGEVKLNDNKNMKVAI